MKIFLPIIKELILESRIHSSPSMLISSTENAHSQQRSENSKKKDRSVNRYLKSKK